MRKFLQLAIFTAAFMPGVASALDINVKLSIPQNITATAGQTVTVPLNLSNISADFTLDSFQVIVSYDPNFFDAPVTSGVQLGTLTTGLSYSGLSNVDSTNHYISILRSDVSDPANLTTSSSGSLATFQIHVKNSAAAGTSGYLNLLATQGASNTEIVTLSGAPDNILFSPTIGTASINGSVVIPAPEPSTYGLATVAVAMLVMKLWPKKKVRV